MNKNKVEFLTLKEVTENYSPAYGENWDNHFKQIMQINPNIMNSLMEELKQNGQFDSPVILLKEEVDNGEVFPASIGDGMHRLAAHYHTGIDKVLVQYEYDLDNSHPRHYDLLTVVLDQDLFQDDLIDKIEDYLSWRHEGSNVSTWLTIEGASGGTSNDIYLYCDDDAKNLLIFDEVLEDVRKRLTPTGTIPLKVYWDDISDVE